MLERSSPISILPLETSKTRLNRLSEKLAEIERGAKREIHVLTLTPFFPSTRNETAGCFIAEPIACLSKYGVTSTVIAVRPIYQNVFKMNSCSPLAKWVRYVQVPGHMGQGSAGLLLWARLFWSVRRIHQRHPIDLIHAHAALPCGHAAALLSRHLRVPYVITVHGLDAFSTTERSQAWARWCEHSSRFVYRNASCAICISRRVEQEVLKVMGRSVKTRVVYNCVDTTLFCPGVDSGKESKITILSVGNLISIKGHDIVLRSVANSVDRYPELRYEIIGSGPECSSLMALARELKIADKVQFLGQRSRAEVAEAMKRCAIFALPSRFEGLGCVYLEAMACGKPVVACRGQGIEEIIRHGDNGWLIEPGNLGDMVKALEVLSENSFLREQMGLKARRTTVEGLTQAHQADQLSQLYQQCLA